MGEKPLFFRGSVNVRVLFYSGLKARLIGSIGSIILFTISKIAHPDRFIPQSVGLERSTVLSPALPLPMRARGGAGEVEEV